MSADLLYDSIRSYLNLTACVVSNVGDHLNVGERFTLRFTGTNTAFASNIVQQPGIIFSNPRLFVQGTPFAKPVDGSGWHNLSDTQLSPGASSFVEIEFEAVADIGWWSDIWGSEHMAKAWIFADLNQNPFFTIRNFLNVDHEIQEA